MRLAKSRQADAGAAGAEPARMLTLEEFDALYTGFTTIRDQEPLDDVAAWANAVLRLLEDEAGGGIRGGPSAGADAAEAVSARSMPAGRATGRC